jgi:high affinity sulfate transporter 1
MMPQDASPGTAPPAAWRRWLPGLDLALNYRREWLRHDLAAGLVLTALLVPAGMAYAEASGLTPIAGLYASIVPLLAYALFGPSRILVLGPDSALAGLIAATVVPLAAGDPARAAGLAGALSVLTGLLCLLAGLARLGFVTDLLSKPIRTGYLNGIALTVLVSQLPKVLGFPAGGGLVEQARGIAAGVADGRTNGAALAVATACLAAILACRQWTPRVPGVFLAVAGATAASAALDLAGRHGAAVVGALPRGLPSFRPPAFSLGELGALIAGAVAIALVSIADTSVLSRAFALRGGRPADADREMVAIGAADLAAGLFQGFPVSSSTSRTPVAEAAGARTQFTGVVGALGIAALLLAAPGLLSALPLAALGAVVIAACLSLFDWREPLRLWRVRRGEFAVSLVCFVGVALLGVIQGIFIAVALAVLAFLWRAWRPHDAVLGRVGGVKGWHDIARHPEARRVPGLVLYRWDAPLFFANAAIFHERVLRAAREAPTPTRWVVVTAEPVTDIDITAADNLAALDRELQEMGVELCFAEMKGPVKDRLKRYGLFDALGTDNFFPTIGQAVDRYLEVHRVEWKDWDEE